MPADPQIDVRAKLIAGGVGSPALGAADVYVGGELPSAFQDAIVPGVPDRSVFVRELAGAEPKRLHDGTAYRQSLVLVTVRSSKDEFGNGKTLANAVHAALERATLSADYLDEGCEATADRFAYIGVDEIGRHEWQCSFRCIYVA